MSNVHNNAAKLQTEECSPKKKGKDVIKNEKMVAEKQDLGVTGEKLHPNKTYITQGSSKAPQMFTAAQSVEVHPASILVPHAMVHLSHLFTSSEIQVLMLFRKS